MKVLPMMLGCVFAVALVGWRADGQPKATEDADGVEVLARGPVHEAFAQPVLRRQSSAPIIANKPPEPVPELPPDQRPESADVEWLPGYWAWDEDRSDFLWVSGIWRVPPPEHHWVPGYWIEADGGYQWVSGHWSPSNAASQELLPTPPEPIAEAIPVAPDAESTFVPGTWVYRERRYWWRPGYWIAYRPGWTWCTAGYFWTPGGYVFVDGHWDHDLHHRGLCFAPVFFDRRFYGRPGWHYRPRYAVSADFFLGSLFVNIGWNHYYFGDYYDSGFGRRGYRPWIDYRVGDRYYDPLFAYYRWQHRSDLRWERDLRATYVARREGTSPRPPRTLAEQQRLQPTAKGKQLQVVASLDQLRATSNVKLQSVSKIQAQQVERSVVELRTLSQNRRKLEAEARASVGAKPMSEPIRIDLPRPSQVKANTQHDKTPPPKPALPKVSTIPPEKSPGVLPKQPPVVPKEPNVLPKDPKVAPKDFKVVPKEPQVIPKEPGAKPTPPPAPSKEPPPPKDKGGQPGKKKSKDKGDADGNLAWHMRDFSASRFERNTPEARRARVSGDLPNAVAVRRDRACA